MQQKSNTKTKELTQEHILLYNDEYRHGEKNGFIQKML